MVRCIFRKRRLLKPPHIKSKTGCPEVDLLTEFHCSVFCKLVHYIHSQLSMRLISIEWLTVILITVLMRAST